MMKLASQVLITSNIEAAIAELEAVKTTERFVKIVKEDTFLVEDAKLAVEKAYLASEETTVIILAAKLFSPIAQNKLLKVIEEPPAKKEFILLTSSKATILGTIRSRLPVATFLATSQEEDLGLEIKQLSLGGVYEFIQAHQRTNAKEMKRVVERIGKAAMYSGAYDIDEKTLTLFSDAFIALDMGSPPTFVLNALLLKLLARKKALK
ncbi:MAG: polymerase subunit delta [Campylobacterota bacterium]|nr:polymerase subunit delta [Campylobacterota bacterium]